MDMSDWIENLEHEIESRARAAIERGYLISEDERMECCGAPDGSRAYFSIRAAVDDRQWATLGEESQDPGWSEPT